METSTSATTDVGTLKVVVAWIGLVVGSVTLSQVVLFFTLVFTILQIVKICRDLWGKKL